MEMPLICWIGLIWIASSSSSAAPMTTNRRSLIGGLSDAKFALMPKPLETSRAPAITTKASESYSTTRSATLEGPAFVTKADPISAGTKPLPEKSLSSQSSTLTTPASSHITGSQSNSLHIPKTTLGLASGNRKLNCTLPPGRRKLRMNFQICQFGASGQAEAVRIFWPLYRFAEQEEVISITMAKIQNNEIQQLDDCPLFQSNPEEAQRLLTTTLLIGRASEAKVTKGNAETKDLTHKVEGEKNLASEKEKNSASKTEQTDLPASSWWDLVNVPSNALYSLVDTVKSRLPQSLQSSPAPEHLLGEVTKPSTGNALVTTKAEQDHAPRLSWYQMMDVPRNVYKSLADRVKPSPLTVTVSTKENITFHENPDKEHELNHAFYFTYAFLLHTFQSAPSPASTPPSQTLVQVTDPSASKAASTAPEVASDSQQTKQQSSVVKHGDPAKTTAPDEEPPLTVELKKEVARAQLEGLINGILQPIVSKYLTPDKTGRMTDKWLRKKNAVLRWAAKWVPDKYSHNFIREKIAPSFVKGFSNWVSKTIMKVSPESMFEILERNSIEFLATVNKAHGEHPPPTP
ncbi:hypothetical protein H4Q26_000830 [Puccinia striiformis f. sp. tritici PST-130]|nr:hypothetical protein H4Q26_000830 [Puccinia striiformis f. sp. tritici PST-130]